MIKTFGVTGLQGKWEYNFTFQPDLNILTGKNGSGKTTFLKLLWYCLSGNVARIRAEMTFEEITLETTSFKLNIQQASASGEPAITYDLEIGGIKIQLEDEEGSASAL